MASHNIQHLFSIIRPEQVEQYLASKGWQCVRGPEQLSFTLNSGPDGEPRSLILPSDPKHPRLRKLLPNVVFSLAVTYSRDAIDIANDIADQQVSAVPVTTNSGNAPTAGEAAQVPVTDARPVQIELINGQTDKALQLRSRSNQQSIQLPAGDSLQLTCKPAMGCRIVLMHDCEMDFDGSRTPEMALGYPTEMRQWPGRGWSVSEGLINYLQTKIARLLDHQKGNEIEAAADKPFAWMTDLVSEFTFLVGADLKQIDVGVLNRASARFLMGVRQQFVAAGRQQPTDSVVDLARLLLGIGGQGVVADSTSLNGLAKILEIDNPSAPQKTVEWLSLNARGLYLKP